MHHVILGAGPAGVIAAETIRKHAPDDRITLVGDEGEPPYSRMAIPYLLIGNVKEAGTYLRKSLTHYADLRIDQVGGGPRRWTPRSAPSRWTTAPRWRSTSC
jgi:NADPH-dependent 2,4-dienoyl-CoA reductase/sulfur reductase-like enzyme